MSVTYTQEKQRDTLKEFGFNWLTGEACAFSLRILFDLNEDGVALFERAFGVRLGDNSPRNMNSQVNGKPATHSCMISWSQIDDIVKYGLAERHALNGEWVVLAEPKEKDVSGWGFISFVWAGTKEEYGLEVLNAIWEEVAWTSEDGTEYPGWVPIDGEDQPPTYYQKYYDWRTISVYNAQPHVGGRNVHAMSGRYE